MISLVAFLPAVSAQVTLDAKQREESKITERSDIKVLQKLQLAGQEVITKNKQIIITEYVTGSRANDGTLRSKATIKKWNGEWEFPGGIMMDFNSEVPGTGIK